MSNWNSATTLCAGLAFVRSGRHQSALRRVHTFTKGKIRQTHFTTSQLSCEVDLPRDFYKTACRIKMLPCFILRHRFNHRVGHAFPAKIIQGVFNEPPPESMTAKLRGHGEIWNAAFASFTIDQRCDVAGDVASSFCHKDAARICRHVFIDVAGFAPAPVMAVKNAARLLDVLLQRHAGERRDCKAFDDFQIGRPIISNRKLRQRNFRLHRYHPALAQNVFPRTQIQIGALIVVEIAAANAFYEWVAAVGERSSKNRNGADGGADETLALD